MMPAVCLTNASHASGLPDVQASRSRFTARESYPLWGIASAAAQRGSWGWSCIDRTRRESGRFGLPFPVVLGPVQFLAIGGDVSMRGFLQPDRKGDRDAYFQ